MEAAATINSIEHDWLILALLPPATPTTNQTRLVSSALIQLNSAGAVKVRIKSQHEGSAHPITNRYDYSWDVTVVGVRVSQTSGR